MINIPKIKYYANIIDYVLNKVIKNKSILFVEKSVCAQCSMSITQNWVVST